jgi:hypothetical protein
MSVPSLVVLSNALIVELLQKYDKRSAKTLERCGKLAGTCGLQPLELTIEDAARVNWSEML